MASKSGIAGTSESGLTAEQVRCNRCEQSGTITGLTKASKSWVLECEGCGNIWLARNTTSELESGLTYAEKS